MLFVSQRAMLFNIRLTCLFLDPRAECRAGRGESRHREKEILVHKRFGCTDYYAVRVARAHLKYRVSHIGVACLCSAIVLCVISSIHSKRASSYLFHDSRVWDRQTYRHRTLQTTPAAKPHHAHYILHTLHVFKNNSVCSLSLCSLCSTTLHTYIAFTHRSHARACSHDNEYII